MALLVHLRTLYRRETLKPSSKRYMPGTYVLTYVRTYVRNLQKEVSYLIDIGKLRTGAY